MVLHLAICYVSVLLQMTCRSPKGKNIVTNDQSTPVAKRTRLSSQSSKDSNCERFRTPFNSHIYSCIFDVASPIVERVVEFDTLKTTFVPQIFESRGVLNFSVVESLEDWDESRVRLAIGVDWSLVTMLLPLGERQVFCKRTNTQQRTKCNTTRYTHQFD